MSVNQDYANNVTRILEKLGDDRAGGSLRGGALVGGYLADLGQTINLQPERELRRKQIEAQTADLQSLAQERQFHQQQIGQAQEEAKKGQTALVEALNDPSNRDASGNVDHAKVAQAVYRVAPGYADNYLKFTSEYQDRLDKMAERAKKFHQESTDELADLLDQSQNPDQFESGMASAHASGVPIDPQMIDQRSQEARQAFAQGPEGWAAFKKTMIGQSTQGKAAKAAAQKRADELAGKMAEPMKVGPNEEVIIPGTKEVIATGLQKEPNPPAAPQVGTLGDYILGKYGPNATPAQKLQARKEFNQSDDRVNVNVSGSGDKVPLTPEAIEGLGAAWRILGNAGIPTRFDENDKKRIINAGTEQRLKLGQTPVEAVQRQAAYKADSAALTKMQTMKSAAEAYETKADAQAGLVSELSKKVGRTQSPLVNSLLLAGKENIAGDDDTHLFANALLTFSNEYAKILEGATGSVAAASVGARQDAKRLISTALNKGTLEKTVKQMQWEMQQTIRGYDATIGHITDHMTGGTPAPTTAPPPAGGGEWIDLGGGIRVRKK